ncbi:GPW/gp25 family protein [Pseudomonas jilinensis]|uniref:Baseplate assembly protein n=1 Tax=Pseudomonas jilinensis TaxID=2078689 RepID=A0A396SDV3_9PSED|nr:baseplate assembly protein [Pseudomonas jilinensis]
MIGMHRDTGRSISGSEHLRQSLSDILTTPLGSRVMRREYGSLLPELIDQPQNPATLVRLYAATAVAVMRWEPRFRLSRVEYSITGSQGLLDLEGEVVSNGSGLNLRVALQLGGVS